MQRFRTISRSIHHVHGKWYRTPSQDFRRYFSVGDEDTKKHLSEDSMAGKARKFLLQNKDTIRGPLGQAEDSFRVGTKIIPTEAGVTPVADAKVFPKLDGLTSLDDRLLEVPSHRSVTVLLFGFNQFGIDMAREWYDVVSDMGFTSQHQSLSAVRPKKVKRLPVKVIELSVVEGWLFSSGLMSGSVRQAYKKGIDPGRHPDCAVWFGSFGTWKKVLGTSNKAVGYVCVLDTEGRVRWKASGHPTDEDSHELKQALEELLKS